jgi:acetyl esterase/lipase
MSPSPIFDNSPFTFEQMMETRAVEEKKTLARYSMPTEITLEDALVPGALRNVPIRIYKPASVSGMAPLLIWHHGGAFIGGGLNMPEAHFTSTEIALRANAVVVAVDYTLCTDDTKFPASQQDALEVALWCIKNTESLGVDPSRIFIGGASAGACLSGSLELMLRDRGIKPAGTVLIYPVGHLEELEPSAELRLYVETGLGKPASLLYGHHAWLLGDQEKSVGYYPFPASGNDLSNLPRHLIIHADFDILRSTGEPWAQQLRESGVEVLEQIEAGTIHGYLNSVPSESEGMNRTLDSMSAFILNS